MVLLPADDVLKPDGASEFDAFCTLLRDQFGTFDAKQTVLLKAIPKSMTDGEAFKLPNDKGKPRERSYEDYDFVYKGVVCGIKMIKNSYANAKSYAEKDIAIEITAGFKIFSIAAAMASMNSDIVFQYVNTIGEPIQYDANIVVDNGLES